jgi:tartrate/fumarate subfamily iron-sulfur-dependent hydro-lyase beta chain
MAEYFLNTPLSDKDITPLKVGDIVYFSGKAFTSRSRLQKYAFNEGHDLPFSTKERNLLIHVGPIVIKKDGEWELVTFMPTSSIRFEKWGPLSIKEWGLKAIIGKTTMGKETMEAMRENKCIHVSPQSVSPNLWKQSIKVEEVFLFDELGTIEASWQLSIDKLGPFIVDIDSQGNNYFDELDIKIEEARIREYERLGISEDFEYTKL